MYKDREGVLSLINYDEECARLVVDSDFIINGLNVRQIVRSQRGWFDAANCEIERLIRPSDVGDGGYYLDCYLQVHHEFKALPLYTRIYLYIWES